ncbi:MAG TPA: beta-ketoacyl-ACP synthase II [Solirubrobacterales bacterium]|nr:beta-ketoacyl-ACP synthase II [Solirubrobacterales bacterium]
MSERVVVTGTGAVTSLGNDSDALVERWIAGETGIEDGSSRCQDFDPKSVLGRKGVRRSDRFTHFAIGAADEALAEAGWEQEEIPYEAERVACIVGTGVGGMSTLEAQVANVAASERGYAVLSPMTVPMMMSNSAAGYLALRYGLRGPSFSVGSACATGGHTIGTAVRMIQSGEADAVVTGASEAAVTPLGLGCFRAMEALSPSGRSLPFDARRDGFVMGEGGGALVLEAASQAEARGARPVAEILGYGTTTDAYHMTAPDPEARGAVRAIELALEGAGVRPEEVEYVNAHGTATELNDRSETIAIKRVFGEHAARLPVSSTKSAIGHLLGASGLVEAVAAIGALRREVLPPTVGYEEQEEGMDLDYVPEARALPRNGQATIALSNAFGFGGHNVVVCLAVPAAEAATNGAGGAAA